MEESGKQRILGWRRQVRYRLRERIQCRGGKRWQIGKVLEGQEGVGRVGFERKKDGCLHL